MSFMLTLFASGCARSANSWNGFSNPLWMIIKAIPSGNSPVQLCLDLDISPQPNHGWGINLASGRQVFV